MIQNNWSQAKNVLTNNGLIIAPTDTIYGILGNALSKKTVERIYKLKGRDSNKPFIVLINSYKHLEIFGIRINYKQAKILEKFWPGKVSVVLSCKNKKWKYIHRGTNSIAFRMISKKNKNLFKLIEKVGPIVAPSANPQGLPPAQNIKEAKKYFSTKIDIYINGGKRISKPSKIISLTKDDFIILRK